MGDCQTNGDMDKSEIVRRLRESTGIAKVSLPRDIGITLDNFVLKVKIEKPTCNMQSNNSSFEGWILALRCWLSDSIVRKVTLDWNGLDSHFASISNNRLHYNRFLFRTHMFSQMYPDWFKLSEEKQKEVDSFYTWLKGQKCLINTPIQLEATDCSERRSERGVESLFSSQYSDLLKTKTGVTYLNSQLPVGLFRGEVSKKNAVFTRGLSAIDLWGIDSNTDTLCVYELKYKNKMIGIISELFFYLMILNEACCKTNSWLIFEDKAFNSNARGINELTKHKFSNMRGYLLSDTIHPLIDDRVITLLNEGLHRVGNIKVDKLTYNYNSGDLAWLDK